MNESRHTVLCVDDEKNILNSLKRLLRRENYRLLTGSNGEEGLEILKKNEVNLVLCDQRMPEMSGTELLSIVKVKYPDVIRIILTGYTEVDSITEAINQGNIYKFLLKPWNDQNLKLEIKQALEQYDLIQANKELHEQVLEHVEELQRVKNPGPKDQVFQGKINETLEERVRERTREIELQNQALELSRTILEDLSFPVIGVSSEGMIVMINREAQFLSGLNLRIGIGKSISDYFSNDVGKKITWVLDSNSTLTIKGYQLQDTFCDIDLVPLSGRFRGKGVVMVLDVMEK